MNPSTIDQIMEQASARLAATDYSACEKLCEQALVLAREQNDFDRYHRILYPLQEARRQRRQTAVDAGVFLITERQPASRLLARHTQGCLVLIAPPHQPEDLKTLRAAAHEKNLLIEALLMDEPALKQMIQSRMELHGDALLASLPKAESDLSALLALEARLAEIGDHEIAHQRLQALARQLVQQQARSSAGR